MDVRRNGKICKFIDVYIGDVFYFDKRYYLRTHTLNTFNAVDLETGAYSSFHDSTEVVSCEGYYYVK